MILSDLLLRRLRGHPDRLVPAQRVVLRRARQPWAWEAVDSFTGEPYRVGSPATMRVMWEAPDWHVDRAEDGTVTVMPKEWAEQPANA